MSRRKSHFLQGFLKVLIFMLAIFTLRIACKQRFAKKDGDIIIGALFPVHRAPSDTSKYTRTCGEIWEQYGIHRVEIFFLIIEEINNNPDILPNVTLGWDIRDSCWYAPIAMEQSIDFIKTSIASLDKSEGNDTRGSTCRKKEEKPIAGLIGPGSSQNTIQVQNMLQMFHIPQIGYSATSMDLSSKNLYKYFVRVVPSDKYQAQAMVDIVLRYNWTYISTVHTDGNYGTTGIDLFQELAKERGLCIANSLEAPNQQDNATHDRIIKTLIETDRARVIVCFCEGMTIRRLYEATERVPKAKGYFVILGSDGWADRPDVVSGIEETAAGGISIKLLSKPIPSFDNYFLSLRPEYNIRNPWFLEYWQWKFGCYLNWLPLEEQDRSQNKSCTGNEHVTKHIQDAKLGYVVKAVYALAYALHNMHQDICDGHPGICPNMIPIHGSLLIEYLMNVSFTSYSDDAVFFDKNGDPPPRYEIMNFQKVKDSSGNDTYQYNRVGTWVAGHLQMNDSDIYWPARGFVLPIKSTCSDACPKGSVKKIHRNIACCWVCTPCEDNEIMMDSYTCKPCSRGWWPNENLTACRVIPIEYTSWWTTEAMATLITVSFGIFVTLWITVVFLRHNNTPVVKASTRELSYIILVGIISAFSSNFVILAKPTMVTCYFTRIIPGLSFSLIYGALVTRTNRIARILEGTKKIITKKPRFMSASAQVIITCILVGVECAIITIMLVIEPADSKLDYSQSKRVRLICNTTTSGIIVPLGFDLILIFMCTLYAIKTRNLPENFNEAKFIGFSMYTTCVIWLGFLAIYFGSEQRVITLSISVSLSATVALVLLFFPKVYVMIWTPEKNTRSCFTTSKEVRCHIGSISCASGESAELIRDKKSADLLRVPLQRKSSLLTRLRCAGSPNFVLKKQNSQKLCKTSTTHLTRGNSFHVPATRSQNENHQTFSWAKLAAKNEESNQDRLSTISSKEDSPESRKGFRTSKVARMEVGCQTDMEFLEGLLSINQLRRRRNQKRTIHTRQAKTHNTNLKDNGENIRLRALSVSSSESGCLVGKSQKQYKCSIRSHLHRGNSESSVSSSDYFENEDDFVYNDSMSDLLKVRTSVGSIKPDMTGSDKYLKYTPDIMRISKNPETCLTFKNTSVGSINVHVPERELTLLSPHECKTKLTKNLSDSCITHGESNSKTHGESNSKELYSCLCARHSISNILCDGRSFKDNDILPQISAENVRARSNSSCLSVDSSAIQTVTGKESKSPSHSSFCSISSSPRSTSTVYRCLDNVSDKCVLALDEEEESMILFQSFLRERGVEFDMSYVESSDV